jgi:hypothetical protein
MSRILLYIASCLSRIASRYGVIAVQDWPKCIRFGENWKEKSQKGKQTNQKLLARYQKSIILHSLYQASSLNKAA